MGIGCLASRSKASVALYDGQRVEDVIEIGKWTKVLIKITNALAHATR